MNRIFTNLSIMITIILLCTPLLVLSQTMMDRPMPFYTPECWRGDRYAPVAYQYDRFPPNSLAVGYGITPNEPYFGYPMRSGSITGISDTLSFYVEFQNGTSSDYFIGTQSPETWIYPVIYEIEADPHVNSSILDTSDFDFSFWYWSCEGKVTTKPSTIPRIRPHYAMNFKIWGIPAGRFRLILKKSSLAPSALAVPIGLTVPLWVTEPQKLSDTLNAYAKITERALELSQTTDAQQWVDSIFVRNSTSLIGWRLQTQIDRLLSDSASIVADYDSILAIAQSYRDPVMSDSSRFSKWDKNWYENVINMTTFSRWKLTSGNRLKIFR